MHEIAANIDPEQIGYLTLSHRDDHYYVIDGHHRMLAVREALGPDQHLQCQVYEGLTEEEEAEMFLKLNDVLTVTTFSRFKVAVTAGRPEAVEIDRVVRQQHLIVTRQSVPGKVTCVGALERVYRTTDAQTLGRALRIIRDCYGDAGFQACVVEGIGNLCGRYNGELDEDVAVTRLRAVHGGVNGLLARAETVRLRTGNSKGQCVAAAAVDVINGGRGGRKLPSWWKTEAQS